MSSMGRSGSDALTLVSADWLKDHLAAPDVRVLDGTWRVPPTDRDARADYEAGHIPGAMFFDIDDIADDRSELPHMMPPVEKFVSRVRKLGVGDGHRIIVYDQDGLFSAARVWWMFRYFGHQEVAVLDGGLPAWTAAGGALEDLPPSARDRHFTPRVRSMMLSDVTQVSEALKLDSAQLVDARSAARFKGEEPEPRPGLRSGHMPGALNVPYRALLEPDGRMKPVEELETLRYNQMSLTNVAIPVDGSVEVPFDAVCGHVLELEAEITGDGAAEFGVTVCGTADGEYQTLSVTTPWRVR